MENNDKRFYVYLYRRKDTNDVCYVGKGTKGRAVDFKGHNEHCNNIYNKVGLDYEIIADNLTNEEALELEEQTVRHYVFDLGYGIDIDGYRKRNSIHQLCNCDFGGTKGKIGICHLSEEELQKRREKMLGENNVAKREDVREKISKHAREHNSFALPEVKEKLSKNHYMKTEEGKRRASKRMKDFYKTEKGKEQLKRMRDARKGKPSSNSVKVVCVETNEIYDSYTDFQRKTNINRKTLSNQINKNGVAELKINDKTFHFKNSFK